MQLASSTDAAAKRGKKTNGKRRVADEKETLHLKTKKATAANDGTALNLDNHIATAAYFLAEQRGFAPGHELEDWLVAEQRVRSQLT